MSDTVATPPALRPVLNPFTIIVDTREQLPYTFANIRADARQQRRPVTVPTNRGTLKQGDYSVDGLHDYASVERKSDADLYGTLGQSRARFIRELERLNQYHWAAVVIERELSYLITNPPEFSKLHPKTVHRSILTWNFRYPRIHWFFCPNREFAEITTFRILERLWKEHNGRNLADKHEPTPGN